METVQQEGLKNNILTKKHLFAMFANKIARTMFYLIITAFIAYHYKESYGFEPSVMQILGMFASLSGLLRPVFAYFSDTRPIKGYRRKSYGFLGNLFYLGAITMMFGAIPAVQGYLVFLSLSFILYSIAEGLMDASYDAFLLDLAGDEKALKDNGKVWMRMGALVGNVLGYLCAIAFLTSGWLIFLGIVAGTIILSTIAISQTQEKKVTRAELNKIIEDAKEKFQGKKEYKRLIYQIGFFLVFAYMAGPMVNVLFEPAAIETFGGDGQLFYMTELFGSLIAVVVLVLVARWVIKQNLNDLIIPLLLIAAWFYIAMVWLTPNLGFYLLWNTIRIVQVLLSAMVLERILMDIVKGQKKGTTFQVFTVFLTIAGLVGMLVGSIIFVIGGFHITLISSAIVLVSSAFIYGFILRKKIAKALEKNKFVA